MSAPPVDVTNRSRNEQVDDPPGIAAPKAAPGMSMAVIHAVP
jgi:hypothetical protein